MKEKIKRFFGASGGFLGRVVTPLAVAVVVVFVLGWFVGWPVATAYLAHDSGFHRGWTHDLVSNLTDCRKSLDTSAVENAKLQYERDSYKQAAERLQTQLATMIPIGEALWCTNMSPGLIAKDKQEIVLATVKFVAGLSDVDTAPAGVCVVIVGIAGSEVRGEMYVPVQRVFSSGAADPLTVYWQVVPGEEGKAKIIGYYSWITREWHPVETAP